MIYFYLRVYFWAVIHTLQTIPSPFIIICKIIGHHYRFEKIQQGEYEIQQDHCSICGDTILYDMFWNKVRIPNIEEKKYEGN